MEPEANREPAATDPQVVNRLVDGHRQFLSFLQARLPDRNSAEEILQAAYVRAIEKGGEIRERESSVAWFYRLLRNALVDHYRKVGSEARRRNDAVDPDSILSQQEARNAICACMKTLLPTLKPEYAEIIEKVDLQEAPLAEVAEELNINANNASVRLHRARQALGNQLTRSCGTCATHGCLNCTCK